MGSVVAKLMPGRRDIPPFVTLPQLISDAGNLTPGQFAGYLGRSYDPFTIRRDPSSRGFQVDELALPPDVSLTRLEDRRALLQVVDQQLQRLEHSAAR
jgi:hypothetical protein